MAQGGTDLVAVKERSVYTLAPQHNDWTQHPDNPYPEDVEDICFCSVPGGLFGMGGRKNDYVSKQCHYFNGTSWERKTDMKNARHSASAAVLGNEILVVGGKREPSQVYPEEKNKGERFTFVGSDMVWQSLPSLVKPSMKRNQLLDAPMLKPLVASAAGILFVVPRAYHISPNTCMQQLAPRTDPDHFVKVRLPNLLETDTKNLPETERANLQVPEDARYICKLRESNCACLVGFDDLLYLMGGLERMTFQYNPSTEQWTNLCPIRAPHRSPEDPKGSSAIVMIDCKKILVCGVPMGQENRRVVDGFDIETKEWKLNHKNISVPFIFDWKNCYWNSM